MEQKAIDRLIDEIRETDVYKEYEQAYAEVTKLPLIIRSKNPEELIPAGMDNENEFCAFMRKHNDSCKTCLHLGQQLPDGQDVLKQVCFAGVHVAAVPIRVNKEVIGYLQTGEVLLEKSTSIKLEDTTKQLLDWGIKLDKKELEMLLDAGALLSPKQYEAVIKMLEIFAKHISEIAARLSVIPEMSEPDAIRRSREFIRDNSSDRISLDQVASVANMSASHFCRVFKKATDMNFSEYVARVRIEKAKNMLLESNYTMTHIAFDTGFNSVTDFNRTFKKLTGVTPTGFRKRSTT
ncbi:MAG: helix-turn-helix domain-containing protein [Bacteroidetes bacterium]|nr:helix-turn-helix domain-containing protein [Bacteroidota bacterium]